MKKNEKNVLNNSKITIKKKVAIKHQKIFVLKVKKKVKRNTTKNSS